MTDDTGQGNYTLSTALLQVLITIAAFLFFAPILMIINYSFKTKRELYLDSPLALPESLNLENYISAYNKLDLATTFTNTLFYTVSSVALLVILCGAAAWAIARRKEQFFRFSYYILIGILIPYQALFLDLHYRVQNRVNEYKAGNYTYVCRNRVFIRIFMTSFMTTVPLELEESARIDGCSVYRTYFTIVMPLLKPAGDPCDYALFQIWNDYLMANLFLSSKKLKTLTVCNAGTVFPADERLYDRACGDCGVGFACRNSLCFSAEIL